MKLPGQKVCRRNVLIGARSCPSSFANVQRVRENQKLWHGEHGEKQENTQRKEKDKKIN
jgi:hypothetical protein